MSPTHTSPAEQPDEQGSQQPLSEASLIAIGNIQSNFWKRGVDSASEIAQLASKDKSAALSLVPELFRWKSDTPYEYLLHSGFTKEELQDAAASAFLLLAKEAYEQLNDPHSQIEGLWEGGIFSMNSLAHTAELQHHPRKHELIDSLKAALVTAYESNKRDAPTNIRHLIQFLGGTVDMESLKAHMLQEIRKGLESIVDANHSSITSKKILSLADSYGEMPEDIKALARKAWPFGLERKNAKKYIEVFSIPREDVERVAKEKARQEAADIILHQAIDRPDLYKLNEFLKTLELPPDCCEAEMLPALDAMIDAGKLLEANELFHSFVKISSLEDPVRREKAKKTFVAEIAAVRHLSQELQPSEYYEERGPGPLRRVRVNDTVMQGALVYWYSLGHIPVLYEALDEAVRNAAEFGSSGYSMSMEKFTSTIRLPEGYVASPETQKRMNEWFAERLTKGNVLYNDIARRCGVNMQDPKIQEAALAGMVALIRSPKRNVAQNDPLEECRSIETACDMPEDTMDRPEIRDAFRHRMYTFLETGKFEEAVSIKERMGLTEEFIAPGAEKAACTGFVHLMERGQVDEAMAFAQKMKLKDSEIVRHLDSKLSEDPLPVLQSLELLPGRYLQKLDGKHHVQTYLRDLGVPSVEIYKEYCRLREGHDQLGLNAHVAKVKEQLESMVSGEKQDADIAKQPHYRELMEIVYPNNSGTRWTNFESNESCEDRTDDLRDLVIRKNYSFTVAPGSDMILKEGRSKNSEGLALIQSPVEKAHAQFAGTDFDRETMLRTFDAQLETDATMLNPPDAFRTREEKIFGLLLEHAAGRFSPERFKELLIGYQYAEFDDIRNYIEGTQARAEQTRNPDYAYLLELREFFADRLKEVSRRIAERALQNPALQDLLPRYFRDIAAKENNRVTGEAVNKMQIDKLGLSEGFLKQIAKSLKRSTGTDYTSDQIRALIRDYEDRTAGLVAQEPESDVDVAVYRQIRSQREKTIRALEVLSGTAVHPSEIRLGDINLHQYLEQRRTFQSGEYDEKTFASYVSGQFGAIFEPELSFLDEELTKYEPNDAERKDAKPKRVEAFITKNHTSAHARQVAGVCVAGDNPMQNGEKCQWRQSNYFQMVLRDADTKLCKGCVLLHLEEDNGKKILTAAPNPSSTYLYQVNEEEMFRHLRAQLIVFAEDNDIDAIAVSKNQQIRTNRTGGLFERAMDQAITETKQDHTFSEPRVFSYNPVYKQDAVDFIWVKPQPQA